MRMLQNTGVNVLNHFYKLCRTTVQASAKPAVLDNAEARQLLLCIVHKMLSCLRSQLLSSDTEHCSLHTHSLSVTFTHCLAGYVQD